MHKSIATLIILCFTFFISCSDNSSSTSTETETETTSSTAEEVHPDLIQPSEVEVTTPLNATWVDAGKQTYELKCQSCHKLTD